MKNMASTAKNRSYAGDDQTKHLNIIFERKHYEKYAGDDQTKHLNIIFERKLLQALKMVQLIIDEGK